MLVQPAITAMRVDLYAGISLGTVAGIALAPAWLPRLRGFSGGPGFAAATRAWAQLTDTPPAELIPTRIR